jgi:hypothetical protein
VYRHILLPTDGSKLSDRAVREAVGLAKTFGAKITALHVMPTRAERRAGHLTAINNRRGFTPDGVGLSAPRSTQESAPPSRPGSRA